MLYATKQQTYIHGRAGLIQHVIRTHKTQAKMGETNTNNTSIKTRNKGKNTNTENPDIYHAKKTTPERKAHRAQTRKLLKTRNDI